MSDNNECPVDHDEQNRRISEQDMEIRVLREEVEALKFEKHLLQYTLDAVLEKAVGDQ